MSISIRILVCAATICNPDDPIETRKTQLLSAMKRAYNEQFRGEGYEAQSDQTIIWGADEPEHIIKTAKEWNNDIIHDLMNAIGGVLAGPTGDAGPALDTDRTETLMIAAAMANDEPRANAKRLLFNMPIGGGDTSWNYECILSKDQLEQVIQHPEDYAITRLHAD